MSKAKKAMIKELYKKMTAKEIADLLDISVEDIMRVLNEKTFFTKEDEKLINSLFSEGKSINKIAREINVSSEMVRKYLIETDQYTVVEKRVLTEEEIKAIKRMIRKDCDFNLIKETFNISDDTIYRYKREIKGNAYAHLTEEQIEEIKELYLTKNISMNSISKKYGVNVSTISRNIRKLGISKEEIDRKTKKLQGRE